MVQSTKKRLFSKSLALAVIAAMALVSNSAFAGNGTEESSTSSAEATYTDSVAIGHQSKATEHHTISIGDYANANAYGSSALGSNSKATHEWSAAIGAASQTDRVNSVSVGSATRKRQITNVAAGTATTDAVNLGQMEAAGTVQFIHFINLLLSKIIMELVASW